jgi:hypothetical protein
MPIAARRPDQSTAEITQEVRRSSGLHPKCCDRRAALGEVRATVVRVNSLELLVPGSIELVSESHEIVVDITVLL